MTIHYDAADAVATITIDRPERRNALDREHVQELLAAVERASADDGVRAVVLTAGLSGTDLSSADDIEPAHDDWWADMEPHGWWWPIVRSPKPWIAAVDGAAVGQGVELVSHCDFRIASSRARFGWNFVHRGLVPDTGAGNVAAAAPGRSRERLAARLRGRAGPRRGTAKNMGFVHAVVEPEALARTTRDQAVKLAAVSPLSIRLAKQLIYDGLGRSVADHLPAHVDALRECLASDGPPRGRPAPSTGRRSGQ